MPPLKEGLTDRCQGGGQRGMRGAGQVQHCGADDGAVHYSYTPAEHELHGLYREQCFLILHAK